MRASGLVYTIVRPGGLVNTPGAAGTKTGPGDDWRPLLRRTLSREDLASVLIAALDNPATRNVTFELVNDSALPVGAWRGRFVTLQPDIH